MYFVANEINGAMIVAGPLSQGDCSLLCSEAHVVFRVQGNVLYQTGLEHLLDLDAYLVVTESGLAVVPDDGSVEAMDWARSFAGSTVFHWKRPEPWAELVQKWPELPEDVFVTIGWWNKGKPAAAVYSKCPVMEADTISNRARYSVGELPLLLVRTYPADPLNSMKSLVLNEQLRNKRVSGN